MTRKNSQTGDSWQPDGQRLDDAPAPTPEESQININPSIETQNFVLLQRLLSQLIKMNHTLRCIHCEVETIRLRGR